MMIKVLIVKNFLKEKKFFNLRNKLLIHLRKAKKIKIKIRILFIQKMKIREIYNFHLTINKLKKLLYKTFNHSIKSLRIICKGVKSRSNCIEYKGKS